MYALRCLQDETIPFVYICINVRIVIIMTQVHTRFIYNFDSLKYFIDIQVKSQKFSKRETFHVTLQDPYVGCLPRVSRFLKDSISSSRPKIFDLCLKQQQSAPRRNFNSSVCSLPRNVVIVRHIKAPSDSVYICTTVGYRPSTLFSVRVFLVTCMCAQTNLTERERHRERTCYYDGGGIVLYERYPVPAPWCFHGVCHWGGPSKIDRLALSLSVVS